MTRQVAGSFVNAENKPRNRTTKVAHTDLHGDTDSTLQRATDIVTVPSNSLWDVGVYTSNNKETGKVLDLVVLNSGEKDETNTTMSKLAIPTLM